MVPADRRYTKDHEWLKVEGAVARMGITDFAQSELGDIVYVELPAVGRAVRAGDVLGTIESVKAVSEIYAPVAGTITEINGELNARPERINEDALGAGWYCTLQLSDRAEFDALLDAATYAGLIGK